MFPKKDAGMLVTNADAATDLNATQEQGGDGADQENKAPGEGAQPENSGKGQTDAAPSEEKESPKTPKESVTVKESVVLNTAPVIAKSKTETVTPMVTKKNIYIGGTYYDLVMDVPLTLPSNHAFFLKEAKLTRER